MLQVNFSAQSMAELDKLDTEKQLKLIEKICSLTSEQLDNPRYPIGRFHRDGKFFYRLRVGNYRFYFERKKDESSQEDSIYSHYILHKNTLNDFIFRFKLPIKKGQILEEHQSFWKYLETLKK